MTVAAQAGCRRRSRAFSRLDLCRGPAPAPSASSQTPTPAPAPLHPDALARFVDPLPIPPVLQPEGLRPDPDDASAQIPFFRVAMHETEVRVHRDVPATRVWSYGGSVPGPTIETRSGRGLLIEWENRLPDRHLLPIDHTLCGAGADLPEARAIVHVHGARAPSASDGYPEDAYAPGHSAIHHYPNRQDATTLWYHDHAMGIERLNQYAGLFGAFLVRDEVEDALHLPSGPYEIPLVLFDRLFTASGQLHYPTSGMPDAPWVSEFYGDALLVNGKLFPYLEVEPRLYRFRVVNASNSRFYALSLAGGHPFHQIGTDQGLLPEPVSLKTLTLAPAERADLVFDFRDAAGESLILQSQALQLMQFRVGGRAIAPPSPLPVALRPVTKIPESEAVKTRTLTLNEYMDPKTHAMLMLLNATRWHEPVTEKPVLGTVEIWKLVNLTEDTHPIHLHLVRFQVLDRQTFDADEYLTFGRMNLLGKPVRPEPSESGWKDTVQAHPGMITRIVVQFDGYAGRYVWHCHVLEHAANEMMRPFEVVAS
jgi:spore coat protein A, manganese oxidase